MNGKSLIDVSPHKVILNFGQHDTSSEDRLTHRILTWHLEQWSGLSKEALTASKGQHQCKPCAASLIMLTLAHQQRDSCGVVPHSPFSPHCSIGQGTTSLLALESILNLVDGKIEKTVGR